MKAVFFKMLVVVPCLALSVISGGCGYRFGSSPHPQIRTLAVAPVVNETLALNASAKIRKLLCERIVVDGTYKLVTQSKADAIVYVRLTSVNYSEISWATKQKYNDVLYTPNQWRVNISGQYSVIVPGRGTPIMQGGCAGSAEFDTGPDMEQGRQNGLEQAAYEMSKDIVSSLADSW